MSSGQELRQCIAITEEGERCSRPAQDGDFCYQHDENNTTIEDIEDEVDTEDGEAAEEETEEAEGEAAEETEEEDEAGESEGGAEAEREQKADAEGEEAREQKADPEEGESMESQMEEPEEEEEAESTSEESEEEEASSGGQIEITRHEDPGQEEDEEAAEEEEEAEEEEVEDASTEIPDETVADSEIKEIRQRAGDIASEIVGYPFDGIAELAAEEDGWVVAIEVIERSGIPDTQDIIGRYELQFNEDLQLAGYHRTHRYRRDDMEQDI